MFHKRRAHKPDEDFLRDFRRKFSHVATIPYTLGAGIVPDQLVVCQTDVEAIPGLVSNPTLLPSPSSSSSPVSRRNYSWGGFDSPMCAVAHGTAIDHCPVLPQAWMPDPAYSCMARDVQYAPVSSSSKASTRSPREILPLDAHSIQPSTMNQVQPVYHEPQAPRFHITLHAPTATYNPAHQIPVTYLNRRQRYKISIIDTAPPAAYPHPVRYRTHFRIAFENEEQRSDPVAAWRLWRENRGLKEASRGDGQLRAVEFVDAMSHGIRDVLPESHVVLERSSLDGFSIVWLADPQSGHAGCEAHIMFNFLSTDFTLSKGIQGIPLRLCAKTELISPDDVDIARPGLPPETCYCKIKLFRDHGSERKLANDNVKLKKAIDKIHQKLEHSEYLEASVSQGRVNPGKRKRGKPPAAAQDFSGSDELRKVLSDLEAVLSSSQPLSILCLPGDKQDDPDRDPIVLEPMPVPLQAYLGRGSIDMQMRSLSPILKRATQSSSPASGLTSDRHGSYNHAVACFYLLRRVDGKTEDYHHAVYVYERTQSDLLRRISQTYQLGPDGVSHVVRVNAAGLHIAIDDDVVEEITDGQDMVAEFSPDDQEPGRFRVNLFF